MLARFKNRVSLLCRAKLLFVSHEVGLPGKCYKKFPNNFIYGGKVIFVLILKMVFLLKETASEVLILLINVIFLNSYMLSRYARIKHAL